jgi:hypothetical protein
MTMPDLPSLPDTGSDQGPGHEVSSGSGWGRWKTIAWVAAVVLVLVVFVVLHVTGVVGPGEH